MSNAVDAGFFTPLANIKPHLKIAFEGFAGSGKTFTAANIAIGLHKRIRSTKPIVVFDTERAAKFLAPLFKSAGIECLVKDSRTLADLGQTMEFCRDGGSDVLIIDSISHPWEEFLNAYKKKKNRTRLEFQDWGIIKPLWKQTFSDPFVRDPYHCLMCGRAGYEYTQEVDDRGKKQIVKSGVKMKVEGETAYEPDILVLMERFEEVIDKANRRVWREAMILKDRNNLIDGKVITDPSYEDFAPAIELILADPTEAPTSEGDTGALIGADEDNMENRRIVSIELEEIQGDLTSVWPSTTKDEKKHKVEALQFGFGTRSWKKIEGSCITILREGRAKMRCYIYEHTKDERFRPPPDDDLPDLDAGGDMTDEEKASIEAAEERAAIQGESG